MTLQQFLFAPQTMPFAIALGVMLGLVLIEIVTLLLGATLGDGFDVDTDIDGPFDWLHFGSIPLLMLLILLSTGFGLTGYAAQYGAVQLTGSFMHVGIAAGVSTVGMALFTRFSGNLLKRWLLKEDTAALSNEALLGNLATITLGETRKGVPTQAKFKDQFGTTHHVMVEPLMDRSTYRHGDEVVLVEWAGHFYRVVGRDESIDLLDDPSLHTPAQQKIGE